MSKTMRQKSRRLQNRLQFESRVYRGNLTSEECKGVGYRQASSVVNGMALPARARCSALEQIESQAKGAYSAYQKSYKGTGKGKHKTHIRAPSDHLYKLREARKKYRALLNAYDKQGGVARYFDRLFRQKFPKEWRLIIENINEF